MYSQLVHKSLVFYDQTFADQEAFFKKANTDLLGTEFVTGTFYESVVKRESKYPTGLALPTMSIAIPHTDPENINKAFIAVYHLTQPVVFTQMATIDVKVESQLILVLGIKEPKEQVGLLSTIIDLISAEDFVDQYRKIQDQEDMYQLFKKNL
ncbi:PTS sugar transporter subunit IIA [Enterococcus sp. AZ072]|uniref:PTS sugar transporter subunit IIA n=1 Tax=unclassified Enterococcus TaxID=2608891 RepID=UPI003D2D13B9